MAHANPYWIPAFKARLWHAANMHLQREAGYTYRKAIRSGELVPQPCAVCGKEKVDGHHEDYARPLEVVWLCRKHHKRRHCFAAEFEAEHGHLLGFAG